MSKFQRLYESLIFEMPYVSFELQGKRFDFDLELEKHQKDWFGLVRLIHNILGSKSVKDKYDNVLRLQTREEKESFLEELRNNTMFNSFLKRFYNKSFDELIDVSGGNPRLNISHQNNTSPVSTIMTKDFSSNARAAGGGETSGPSSG
jgi:hypothetical protein